MSASAASASPAAAPAPGYLLPSLGWRILGGALRLVPLVVFLIGLPVAALTFLQSNGISLPVPILTVEVAGIAITALIVARYILKPTVAFGPLSIATSAVTLLYLWVIFVDATYHLAIPNADVGLAIGYGSLILLLMVGPALALTAGILTTIEDARSPKERLPFDFPP
ncbi:MAG: hypothetical protein WBE40_03380 [Thermoplasmata archaeon]